MALRELMMPNYGQTLQQGIAAGRQDRTRRTLSEFMQPAIGGDQQALSKIYGADPQAGHDVQKLASEMKAEQRQMLQEGARMVASMPDSVRPQAYKQFAQQARAAGLDYIPEEYSPEFLPGIQKMAGVESEQPRIVAPGSALVDNTGNLIYERPFAPQKPEYVLSPDGTQWLPKPTGMPQSGGGMGGGFGIAETDNYVRNIMGKVGSIDPNATPEQQAELLLPHLIQQESGGDPNAVSPKGAQGLTQVMPATGQDPGFGVQPMQNGSPQENVRFGRDYLTAMLKRYPGRPDLALAAYNAGPGVADRFAQPQASNGSGGAIPIPGARSRQETKAPSDIERRIEIARSMGATDDQLRQMVIGREGAAAGAKPMPVAALKVIKDETDAANTAQTINTSIDKHLKRIESGKLDFGPVANNIYAARNATGQSTEQSRNFAEFKSDLEKLRNDSLRLNSGVQTDGDAQRAWNELIANINDTEYVKQRMQTIKLLNERARQLRLLNVDMVKSNYGRGESDEVPNPGSAVPNSGNAPAAGGWSIEAIP